MKIPGLDSLGGLGKLLDPGAMVNAVVTSFFAAPDSGGSLS